MEPMKSHMWKVLKAFQVVWCSLFFYMFPKIQNHQVNSCSITHRPDPELDLESRHRLGDVLSFSLTPEANRTPVATVLWKQDMRS